MDCTLAEFCTADPELSSVLSAATNSLNLENPMSAEELLNFHNNTPASEELSENLEGEPVQRHKNKATTEEDNEDSDQEPQEQEPLLKLKTLTVPR